MGISPIFAALDEFTAFIFQQPGSDNPAFVILTNNAPEHPGQPVTHPFPEGEATILNELLAGTGAIPIWTPWNGEYDNHP